MPHYQRLILLLLISFIGLQSISWADLLKLKGQPEQLSGRVVTLDEQKLIWESPNGSRKTFERNGVEVIQFGTVWSSASVPPVTPALGAPILDTNSDQALYFPSVNSGKGRPSSPFVPLSRFKGQTTQSTYAGLYNFKEKGTFWIHLPQTQTNSGQLQFTLYGKQNSNQPTENYSVQARFLDEGGRLIGQTPVEDFNLVAPPLVEWFQMLEGISGLAGKKEVLWSVPRLTKTIQLQAFSPNEERHLVGYVGNLVFFIRGKGQ